VIQDIVNFRKSVTEKSRVVPHLLLQRIPAIYSLIKVTLAVIKNTPFLDSAFCTDGDPLVVNEDFLSFSSL
jgi:hypothetical protein